MTGPAAQPGYTPVSEARATCYRCPKAKEFGFEFHAAHTISAGSSGFNLGSLFGDGDAMFLQVGGNSYGDSLGTAFGAAVYPTDTVDTLAQ